MIELNLQKQLALLFPTSNRAIMATLEQASPQQLQVLSESKDIKSVITDLMKGTLDTAKSNKIILDILKNSVLFKDLGNFSKELKSLIELLNEKSPQLQAKLEKTTKALESSLLNFNENDSPRLKEFVKNSGIFLESKLAQEINPKLELKASLEELLGKLLKSEIPHVKNLIKDIGTLLQDTKTFEKATDLPSLNKIKNTVGNILSQLKNALKFSDPIHSKGVENLVSSLEKFTQTKLTKPETFSLSELSRLITELSSELSSSAKDGTKSLLNELRSLGNKINDIQKPDQTQALIKSMQKEIESIDTKNFSKEEIKTLNSNIQKLILISKMKPHELEALAQDQVRTFFTDMTQNLSQTKTNSIFDILEKILTSLKQPLVSFEKEKIPQDIKSWLNNFEKEVNKGDIVYSKSMKTALEKIELFSKPAHLLNNSLLQENLQKDMKVLLHTIERELSGSTGNTEILKSVDKLLVQIDYYQLLSHLSNASYLYIPYAWDQLENGNLSFKKSKDGLSYCEIDLELCEYGKLNMMLQLFEDNQLNISIYTQKPELKELFKENMKSLRSALVGVNIMPRSIQLNDLEEDLKKINPYEGSAQLDELGFKAKG